MATGRWSAHLLIKQEVLQALQDSGGSIGAGGGGVEPAQSQPATERAASCQFIDMQRHDFPLALLG